MVMIHIVSPLVAMQAQITKLHHRLHKEQGKYSIIWYEVARDIIDSAKTRREIIGS